MKLLIKVLVLYSQRARIKAEHYHLKSDNVIDNLFYHTQLVQWTEFRYLWWSHLFLHSTAHIFWIYMLHLISIAIYKYIKYCWLHIHENYKNKSFPLQLKEKDHFNLIHVVLDWSDFWCSNHWMEKKFLRTNFSNSYYINK